MQKYSSRQFQLKSLKRQAHRLAKEKSITKGEALQALAKENGFKSWQEFRDNVLQSTPSDFDKIPFQEYDSSKHSARQIIGVTPIGEGSNDLQIRISMLSLFDEHFENVKDVRDFFDRKITQIISSSKSHAFIFILLYLDADKNYVVVDFDGFLDNLKVHYPKIINFNVRFSSEPPSIEVVEDWINQTNKMLDNLLGQFR